MKYIKILFRILSLPFLFVFVFFAKLRDTLVICFLWVRYGGEIIPYQKHFNPTLIGELLTKLQKSYDKIQR